MQWATPPCSPDWARQGDTIVRVPASTRPSLTSPPPCLTTGFLPPLASPAPARRQGRGTSLTSGAFPGTIRQIWRPRTTGQAMEGTPPAPAEGQRATSEQVLELPQCPQYLMECLSRVSTSTYIKIYLMSVLYQSPSLHFHHQIF